MHRRFIFIRIGMAALGLGIATAGAQSEAEAGAGGAEMPDAVEESAASPARDWDAPLTLGVFTGEEGVFGQGDLLLPVLQYSHGLLFLNPRVAASDSHQEEINIGIGLRHLLDMRYPLILGVNAYYDGRWSINNNRFDQIGVGVEVLSRGFDIRANYYRPNKDRYRIDAARTETVTERTEEQSNLFESWSDPYAQGSQILQDYETWTITRRTTTTETSWQVYERYEAALEGFDTEIGFPLPWIGRWADTRIFAGYQYFENPFGPDFKGAKARMEVALWDGRITLDAHWYEDEVLNLTDYLVGARLRLPLSWPGGKPALQTDNGGNPAARLTEMVMRDPKVQTRESKYMADPRQRGLITESQTSVSQTAETEGTSVVMEDIVFVNGETGNDANTGTAEAPMGSIQAGINSAYGQQNVYVFEGTYNTAVNVTEGVSLMGSGCPIPANGGRAFGSGIRPVINGGGVPSVVTLQDNTHIQGFEIVNGQGGNGGGVGNGIFSSAENLVIRCNTIHDTLVGVRVDRLGDLNLLLEDNSLMNNGMAGAWISGTGASGSYFVNARGNSFTANGPRGLHLTADTYDAALAILHGNYAFENETGIDVELESDFLSLLSITGTRADNNTGTGIRADVAAGEIAAALVGTPAALLGLAGEVAGLPPEVEALLTSSGPVFANENDGRGLDINVQGGMIGAAALFDVRASGNGGKGANINVWGDTAGIGLVASSENTMELLQLGANVLGMIDPGLELPAMPASPLGPCVFDGNYGDGLAMNVGSAGLALGAVLGVQSQDNEGAGVYLDIDSDALAVGLLARTEAIGNAYNGISMSVDGTSLGLGALLDVRANNNTGNGVDLGVYSEGAAIGLMASTDPLRTLADIINTEAALDPPLAIPGDPWGPSEVSGNGATGVYANIEGGALAAGVFLDLRTDNNVDMGFNADISSESGTAIGLAGSSDTLFDIVPPILGDILFDDPAAIPVPAYAPMGPMTASGNGNGGFNLIVEGNDAFALVGGVRANNNRLGPDSGSGVHLGVTATNGEAFAALYDVTANANAGPGVDINVESPMDRATLSLINVTAEGNAEAGIQIQTASHDDTYLLLTGVDANTNGAQGIQITANSENDIGMAFSAVNANGNTQQGLNVLGQATEDVFVWIGDTSLDAFRDEFGSYDVFGASNSLYALMPGGPSSFSDNGGNGAELRLWSMVGEVGAVTIGNTFTGNGDGGLAITLVGTAPLYSLYGEGNVITGNNDGVWIEAPATAILDFGGILSPGQNSIYGNTSADVVNLTIFPVSAQHNWWGGGVPATVGLVDVSNPLAVDPNP